MKNYFLRFFAGVKKDIPARILSEEKCQDAINVIFEEGVVKTRWGYFRISANVPFDGAVTHMVEFEKLETGEKHFVVFTEEDAYVYSNVDRRFIVITRQYNDGLIDNVSVSGTDVLVDFTGVSFPSDFITSECKITTGARGLVSSIISFVDSDSVLSESHIWMPILWNIETSNLGIVNSDITAIGSGGVSGTVVFSSEGVLPSPLVDGTEYSALLSNGTVAIYGQDTEDVSVTAPGFELFSTYASRNLSNIAVNDDGLAVSVSGNVILFSSDLDTWEEATPDDSYTGSFFKVTYGNGLFIVVGEDGEIQTSPDGETWTHRTADASFTGYFTNVVYKNNVFVAIGYDGTTGEVQSSSDGITWTQQGTPSNIIGLSLDFDGTLWVTNGFNGSDYFITSSPDLATWTTRHTVTTGIACYYIRYSSTLGWVASATNESTHAGYLITSSDGTTWSEGSFAYERPANVLCSGDYVYIAARNASNYNAIFASSNLSTWTEIAYYTTLSLGIESFSAYGLVVMRYSESASPTYFYRQEIALDSEIIDAAYQSLTIGSRVYTLYGSGFSGDSWFIYTDSGIVFGEYLSGTITLSFTAEYLVLTDNGTGQHFISVIGYTQNANPGISFAIRQIYTSDLDNIHDTAIAYDTSDEDNVLLATNGLQNIMRWDGSGYMERLGQREFSAVLTSGSTTASSVSPVIPLKLLMSLSGENIASETYISDINYETSEITLSAAATGSGNTAFIAYSYPNKAKYIDFFGSIGDEHVLIANTNDGISYNTQTIEASGAGEIDVWHSPYSSFFDLLDTNDPIVGIKKLQTRLIIYKKNSITESWAISGGGNSNPFDFNQNKINIGTPSIRTVVDFGDYHIFFGWDNIYLFNGITVVPIGFDIINDLNSGINREFIGRSFSFPIKNKNIYVLCVPYGEDAETCNRAYVYNYVEKHWTIWQFANEMTCFGTFHQENAVLWEDYQTPEVTLSGTKTTGSAIIAMSDTTGLELGYVAEGTGIEDTPGSEAIIIGIVEDTSITLSSAVSTSGYAGIDFYMAWDNMGMRWEELLVYEDNERYVLGDKDGYIYEITDRYLTDNGEDIDAWFTTKDYPLNDPRHMFKLVRNIIGSNNDNAATYQVMASIDFGATWTEPFEVDMEAGVGYIEHIANFNEMGRQVRFKIRNVESSYFCIESMDIEYNEAGKMNVQGV